MEGLLIQWDTLGNWPDTPLTVTHGSHKRVWWVCEKDHRWQAVVKSRAAGAGCPYCTNRKVDPGTNDLATCHPHLAAQWHPAKNGDLTPDRVLPGSHQKAWWICEKGHEWQASVLARTTNDNGCPVCAGKRVLAGENDLSSRYPGLVKEWHPEKNLPLLPSQVTPSSNRSVWWVCPHGHQWKAPVARRVQRQAGCPVCTGKQVDPGFNDLATVAPDIAAQWAQDLNGALTPEMVTAGSSKLVWWRCEEDHVWKAKIYARTNAQRTGCPICAGCFRKKYRNVLEISPETEP